MTDFGRRVGHTYVDRGDPAAQDYTAADLTTDGTWHDLDLSAIAPANAGFINILLALKDNAVNSTFELRNKGNVNVINRPVLNTQVANVITYHEYIVPCDTNQVIQYKATNLTWDLIRISVAGWFKR